MLTAPHEDTIPSSALVNVPTYLRKDVRPRDIDSTGPDSSRVSVNLDYAGPHWMIRVLFRFPRLIRELTNQVFWFGCRSVYTYTATGEGCVSMICRSLCAGASGFRHDFSSSMGRLASFLPR